MRIMLLAAQPHLIELDEDLNGELRAESSTLNHLVQGFRQAHPDRRPPVKFKRRHPRSFDLPNESID